uniref:Rho/rac guanine nucleotide exchange factor (GEF) 18b n=1 Tax=Pygocentrus nattereri TaxID=42514 RepID=A0A3B4DLF7_PYGNA
NDQKHKTLKVNSFHQGEPSGSEITFYTQNCSVFCSSIAGEMDEVDAFRIKRHAEDAVSLAPSTADSVIVEDGYYSSVRQELEGMAQDFEVESWSLAVEQQFLKKHSKDMIKRQDVLYELIQTEMHHVRTLKIMLRVYVYELRETLQLDDRRLDCLFPRLDSLLELHNGFLSRLKERRQEALQLGSDRNYTINRVADILAEQFSGERGERMKESYSAFCSRHTEAVNFYKEQLQSNKKFQNLMRKISNLSIVRRLGVPECILLVTQRITKYPVLVERLLQYTEAGTEEHAELSQALDLIKDTIVKVDSQVSLYEKETRLKEIASKMEARSLGKIKDGRIFRKEDLAQGKRRLLHEGMVNWKAASGRLKDILAVLLTDVLLLLQEKDQRYVFSAVDGKPSVISLQKLIVREVAHEEKAMFLICASSTEPEMYEIHTSSKEERNSWITCIRQAVDRYACICERFMIVFMTVSFLTCSCPHTEERLFSEEEGEARAQRFRGIQERLTVKDAQITQALTEKLQLFAELAESVSGVEDVGSRSRLLLRGDASDLQQGEQLLKGAIIEVENLQNLLASGVRGASPHSEENQNPGSGSGMLPKRADTFGGYDRNPPMLQKNGSVKKLSSGSGKSRDRNQRASSDPQLKEICAGQGLEDMDDTSSPSWNTICPNVHCLLFSLLFVSLNFAQSIISQQDSQIELQRTSLFSAERDRPGRPRGTNVLLEQEKQRNLEKQREELANFQRLQVQHRQEQTRWERERDRQRRQAETAEQKLQEREEECRRLEARLAEERQELERQRQTYQQDLERLRESTRAVEKEKEKLEQQQKKLKKHNTVPSGASLYIQETAQLPGSSSFNGELLLGNAGGDSSVQPRLPVRSSLSLAPADYLERPEVHPRRESSTPLPMKTEVPIHLISTTNQHHKQGVVQQQIPTKLATMKCKDKSSKGKSSHRTDSSDSLKRGPDCSLVTPVRMKQSERMKCTTYLDVCVIDCIACDARSNLRFLPPRTHPEVANRG